MNTITRNNWFPTMMNDFFFNDFMPKTQSQYSTPKMNITETNGSFEIELAAPGMTKDDFTIHLTDNNTLELKMEKKQSNEEKKDDKSYLRKEFSYQSYAQTFTLPDTVASDAIKATMADGILTITLPKKEEKPKVDKMIEIL
ncbi:MAG: Hsp20/alpha crystallin family protein [Prevotella sp.]|nr:Hsp20/alpha crystallin family protein [Prevotella sp.]